MLFLSKHNGKNIFPNTTHQYAHISRLHEQWLLLTNFCSYQVIGSRVRLPAKQAEIPSPPTKCMHYFARSKNNTVILKPPYPFSIVVSISVVVCMIIVVCSPISCWLVLMAQWIVCCLHMMCTRWKIGASWRQYDRQCLAIVRSLRRGNIKESTSCAIKHRRRREAARGKSHHRSEPLISRSKSTASSSGDSRSRLRSLFLP